MRMEISIKLGLIDLSDEDKDTKAFQKAVSEIEKADPEAFKINAKDRYALYIKD